MSDHLPTAESPVTVLQGDCRKRLADLPDGSIHCCVTSPPYFGLRRYMTDGVRVKQNISAEKKAEIIAELARLGVFPIDHI